ncbi:MAG: SCO family protein [Myxococcota bacterium]
MGLLRRGRRGPDAGERGARATGLVGAIAFVLSPLLLLVLAGGCDRDANPAIGRHAAHGTVEDVDRANAQVLIEHDDVPGLMPAMTMNFLVPDPAVLARLVRGQVIDFELEFTGRSYEVVDFEVVGEGAFEAGWRRLGDGLVRSSPVPDFELVDQSGAKVHFAELGHRVVLLDFIYTACPGPCPVQTSRQVALQRRIPEALRSKIRFLSLTLDPDHDGPAELERYAKARGADLANWSFLTGPPETLASLARAYGVGSLRKADGSIDHTLVTFLVHDGRMLERYLPKPGEEDRLLADVVALAGGVGASGEAAGRDAAGTDAARSEPTRAAEAIEASGAAD